MWNTANFLAVEINKKKSIGYVIPDYAKSLTIQILQMVPVELDKHLMDEVWIDVAKYFDKEMEWNETDTIVKKTKGHWWRRRNIFWIMQRRNCVF